MVLKRITLPAPPSIIGKVTRDEISAAGIEATAHLIHPWTRRTPVVDADGTDFGLEPMRLMFKLELLQHAGSFKTRGAFANLLARPAPAAGVVAASGGNHGVAVAYAAHQLKIPARIFVPSVASSAKVERIRRYGAQIVIGGDRYADALAASVVWAQESGAMAIHAFDQPETLRGQGTLGREWEAQSPELDTLLVAVGGGGLIAGIAAWYRGRIRIVAVEPETAPTLDRAFAAGGPVDAPAGGIAADSLAPKRVGELVYPIARAFVERVVLVPDASIVASQRALWDVLRVVTEPGGAAAFAALMTGGYQPRAGERVGVLLCGGNTPAVNFG